MDMEESASEDHSSALEKLGYEFNEQLELRSISTGKGFEFIDQAHYEELADSVAHHIQELMVQKHDMIKVDLPVEEDILEMTEMGVSVPPELRCPIFVSKSAKTADVVLVLLCGTGRVAAGQWARKLCINESLVTGSVIPFLEWAAQRSIGTVVLNPNENSVCVKSSKTNSTSHPSRKPEHVPIPYCSTSEEHVYYVWERVLKPLPCRHFVMVAHSYGGVGTCHLLKLAGEEILDRLRAVAFTDAVHGGHNLKGLPRPAKTFLLQHSINWVTSEESLDFVLQIPHSRDHSDTREGLTDFAILIRMGSTPWAARKILEDMDARECDPEEAARLGGMSSEERLEDRRKGFESIPLGPHWPPSPSLSPSPSPSVAETKKTVKGRGVMNQLFRPDICCKEVSAGSDVHEKTTMSAFDSVCGFLLEELLEMEWEPHTQISAFEAPPAPSPAQEGETSPAEMEDLSIAALQHRQVAVGKEQEEEGEGVRRRGGQGRQEEGGRVSGLGDNGGERGEEEGEKDGGERRRAFADVDNATITETQNADGEDMMSQEEREGEGLQRGCGGQSRDEGEDEAAGECMEKEVSKESLSGSNRKRNHAAADIQGLQE